MARQLSKTTFIALFIIPVLLLMGCENLAPAGATGNASTRSSPRNGVIQESGRCEPSTLRVLNSITHYDEQSRLWVIGELSNSSSNHFVLAAVCIHFITQNSRQTVQRYVGPILLRANERVPFRAYVEQAPRGNGVQIQVTATAQRSEDNRDVLAQVYRQLEVSDVIPMIRLDQDSLSVSGVVSNMGNHAANNIYVTIGLYAGDRLVGVADGKLTSLSKLMPRESMNFTITMPRLKMPLTRVQTRGLAEGRIADD